METSSERAEWVSAPTETKSTPVSAIARTVSSVTPETVVVYSTIKGLDYVSMGALTHSAPALDLSLLLEASP